MRAIYVSGFTPFSLDTRALKIPTGLFIIGRAMKSQQRNSSMIGIFFCDTGVKQFLKYVALAGGKRHDIRTVLFNQRIQSGVNSGITDNRT